MSSLALMWSNSAHVWPNPAQIPNVIEPRALGGKVLKRAGQTRGGQVVLPARAQLRSTLRRGCQPEGGCPWNSGIRGKGCPRPRQCASVESLQWSLHIACLIARARAQTLLGCQETSRAPAEVGKDNPGRRGQDGLCRGVCPMRHGCGWRSVGPTAAGPAFLLDP